MHGKDFDALDRKRRVDDVIVMAWVGARILRGSNALWILTIHRSEPGMQLRGRQHHSALLTFNCSSL